MEETRFKAACRTNSFFVSLEEQQKSTSTAGKCLSPSRRPVSKDSSTFVHFILELDSHRAAVQIVISPFTIESYPRQIFYSCKLQYTLGCQRCSTPESCGLYIDRISTVAQRIYDCFFQPAPWDFSVEDCHSLCLGSPANKGNCTNGAQGALLQYIHAANRSRNGTTRSEDTDPEAPVDQNKRRKFTHTNGPSFGWQDVSTAINSNSDGSGSGFNYSGSGEICDETTDCTSVDTATDNTNVDDNLAEQSKYGPAVVKKSKTPSADSIVKKIVAGIGKVRERNSSIRQLQLLSSYIMPAETASASDQCDDDQFHSEKLKTMGDKFWYEAQSLFQNATAEAWRYRFIFGCLCKLSRVIVDKKQDEAKWSWIRTVGFVNSIVNDLWPTWGAKAAIIYEALAEMDYALYNVAKLGLDRQKAIAADVVLKLPQEQIQWPVTFSALHPAAWISSCTGLDSKKLCEALGLPLLATLSSIDIVNAPSHLRPRNQLQSKTFPYITLQPGRHSEEEGSELNASTVVQQAPSSHLSPAVAIVASPEAESTGWSGNQLGRIVNSVIVPPTVSRDDPQPPTVLTQNSPSSTNDSIPHINPKAWPDVFAGYQEAPEQELLSPKIFSQAPPESATDTDDTYMDGSLPYNSDPYYTVFGEASVYVAD